MGSENFEQMAMNLRQNKWLVLKILNTSAFTP